MQVSKAGEAEVEEISEFLEGEGSREEVLSFLQGAGKEETVFVARLEGQISGIAVVSPSKQPAVFSKWFELEQFMSPELYGSDEHLELLHLLVNPIFLRRVPEILRELLRITESFCLHAAVQDAQAMPRAYQTLTYIPCRRLAPSSPPKDLDPAKTALEPDLPLPAGPPALLHTNFRLLSQPKKDLDDRIVVIGGCETSVGFADAVLSVPYLDLHRVTYVSPGGLALRPPLYKRRSLTLSDAEYRQHAISRGCRVVEGTVSQLDRVEQMVSVRMDSGETVEIKYDHLVLAAGFRDTVIDRLQLWYVTYPFSPSHLLIPFPSLPLPSSLLSSPPFLSPLLPSIPLSSPPLHSSLLSSPPILSSPRFLSPLLPSIPLSSPPVHSSLLPSPPVRSCT
eukprot:763589-Hanusia_phi.AAC.1